MKKIEAMIDPSKMQEVKNALTGIGIRRMTISKVDEFESQRGHIECYRGKEYMINVVKEFKIELTVATDEMLSQVVEMIEKNGNVSPEDILVFPMEEVIQFRTMKKGGRDEKNRSHCQAI
jgi:nitrogen regulatory protein P-II 1